MKCIVGLLCLTLAPQAWANCAALTRAVTLVHQEFVDGTKPSPKALAEIETLISALNNEALLQSLRRSDMGTRFGEVRNFLTQVKFIAQNGAVSDMRHKPAFLNDLDEIHDMVVESCSHPSNVQATLEAQDAMVLAAQQTEFSGMRGGEISTRNKRSYAPAEETFRLTWLIALFFGFLVALGSATSCYYAIVFFRTLRRGRRLCTIPAHMEYLGDQIAGQITVIGKLGCRFVPADREGARALQDLIKGSYANISWNGSDFVNVRMIRDTTDHSGVHFTKPLTRRALNEILCFSTVPPRYDFYAGTDKKAGQNPPSQGVALKV